MNRPCYALSTLLTVLAGFSCLVAPATGKAPSASRPTEKPATVCFVADQGWPVFQLPVASNPILACIAWEGPPLAILGAAYDSAYEEAVYGGAVAEEMLAAQANELPSPTDRPPAPASQPCPDRWCEEYTPYDQEPPAMRQPAPSCPLAHRTRQSWWPPQPATDLDQENGCPQFGRQRGSALAWDDDYQFSFDDSDYQPADTQDESAEAVGGAESRLPAAVDGGSAAKARAPSTSRHSYHSFGCYQDWAEQYGGAVGQAEHSPQPAAAEPEGSVSPEETATLDDTASHPELSGRAAEDAVAQAASEAGKEAAIDDQADLDDWEVEQLYDDWRALASDQEGVAQQPWMWSQMKKGVIWLGRTPSQAVRSVDRGWMVGEAGLRIEPCQDWFRQGAVIVDGLRQNARRHAAQRQAARQSCISLLRTAAHSMQQASGLLESLADQWARQDHQAQQDESSSWR